MQTNKSMNALEKLDKKVEVLAPQNNKSFSKFIDTKVSSNIEPFDDKRCACLSLLSQTILKDSLLRQDPASVALGYWLRKADMKRLKDSFIDLREKEKEIVLTPVGKVFHIAPSNVDTLFVYSWALSFLCGNTNIVRISEKKDEIVMRIVDCICKAMSEDSDLEANNRIVTYAHDSEITEEISRWCNHRVIWGGDETVTAIRPLYLNSYASERIFGSKFSYSVISARWLCESKEDDIKKLASNFFNDMFWFDQMACSSPHILFWIGDKTQTAKAISTFNGVLEDEVKRRNHKIALPVAVKRLNYAFNMASKHEVSVDLKYSGFISLHMLDRKSLEKEICGGGILTHVQAENLLQIADFAGEKDQTITHCGFELSDIRKLAKKIGSKGISRLVPVGEALSFSVNWDGYNLIYDFIKRVVVRGETKS